MTALINQVPMSDDDKKAISQQIKELLAANSRQEKELTTEQINYFYNHLFNAAKRLNVGRNMLEETSAIRENSQDHIEKVHQLYCFLLKILGMYDEFFRVRLTSEQFDRARAKAIRAFYGLE